MIARASPEILRALDRAATPRRSVYGQSSKLIINVTYLSGQALPGKTNAGQLNRGLEGTPIHTPDARILEGALSELSQRPGGTGRLPTAECAARIRPRLGRLGFSVQRAASDGGWVGASAEQEDGDSDTPRSTPFQDMRMNAFVQ